MIETPGQTFARLRAAEVLTQSRNEFALKVRASIPAPQREAMIQIGGLSLALERVLMAQGPSPIVLPILAKQMVRLCFGDGLDPDETFAELQNHIGAAIEETLRAEAARIRSEDAKRSAAAGILPGLPTTKGAGE